VDRIRSSPRWIPSRPRASVRGIVAVRAAFDRQSISAAVHRAPARDRGGRSSGGQDHERIGPGRLDPFVVATDDPPDLRREVGWKGAL